MVYRGKKKTPDLTREVTPGGGLIVDPGMAGRINKAHGSTWSEKRYETADEAAASFYDMDEEERRQFADYLVQIGAIDEDDAWDFELLQQFWEKGVELSSAYTARGKDVTPEDALATLVGWDGSGESAAGRARAAKEAEEAPFSGVRTQISKSINLSDPKSAQALANYVLSKALGREALPEELAQYRDALNNYERSNPQISTTKATYEEGIQTNQETTTKGGATSSGAERVLVDLAREEPDYGEYQAAGPIWNAFLSALSSPVQVG